MIYLLIANYETMTTVDIRIVGNNARKPSKISAPDGVYFQLYASEEYEIPSGDLCVIDSGFEINIPRGYRLVMVSGPSALEKTLLINESPGVGKFSPYLDGETPRLSYFVFNASRNDVLVRVGDPLGRFVLDRTAIGVDIKEVETFEKSSGPDPRFKDIIEIPKSVDSYFKRMYREDRDKCIELFLMSEEGTKILESLEEYKQTPTFIGASNPLLLEAQFVWRGISESIQETVENSFKSIRDKMIKSSRKD